MGRERDGGLVGSLFLELSVSLPQQPCLLEVQTLGRSSALS